jgi:hypothetical protein
MGMSGQHHAPAALYSRGKSPPVPIVGPKAGLDAETRRKILCLCRGSNPSRPVRSQSTILTELPRLQFIHTVPPTNYKLLLVARHPKNGWRSLYLGEENQIKHANMFSTDKRDIPSV